VQTIFRCDVSPNHPSLSASFCFLGDSVTYEFHAALTEFCTWLCPSIFMTHSSKVASGRWLSEKAGLRIVSYNSEKEEIEEWTN